MAFTPIFATGFEHANVEVFPPGNRCRAYIDSVAGGGKVHTGDYSLKLENAYIDNDPETGNIRIRVPGIVYVDVWGAAEIYISAWVYPNEAMATRDNELQIGASTGNGSHSLRIELRSTGCWDVYLDGSNVQFGRIHVNAQEWCHIQVRLTLSPYYCHLESKIDGISDCDYSNTTTWHDDHDVHWYHAFVQMAGIGPQIYTDSHHCWIDDFLVGTGGWPGDVRFDPIIPEADTGTEEWTPSSGSDSFELINDRPPVAKGLGEYLSTGVNARQSIFTCTDWNATDKMALWLVQWAWAMKSTAAGEQLRLIIFDGANTIKSTNLNLLTSPAYVWSFFFTAPDGGAWHDADVDNLQIGIESVIP